MALLVEKNKKFNVKIVIYILLNNFNQAREHIKQNHASTIVNYTVCLLTIYCNLNWFVIKFL